MKFIISIRDEHGRELSSHEEQAEPKKIMSIDAVLFSFPSFRMILANDLFEKVLKGGE